MSSHDLTLQSAVSVGVAAAAIVTGLYQVLGLPLHHDAAWFLHISGEVLNGARLYVDIIEVNPPLIAWLGVPVIMLERATGLSHVSLFPAIVALGALASVIATYRLSREVLSDDARFAFLAVVAFILFLLPASEWGQREHLMLLLTAPYLMICTGRARGIEPGSSWLAGIPAGVGFALKPHFLLAFVGIEAWLYLKRRPVWRGSLLAAGFVLTYAFVALVFTSYVTLLLEVRDVYSGYYASDRAALIVDSRSLLAVGSLLLLLMGGRDLEVRRVFGIATAAWLVGAVLQGKGFAYHFLPVVAGTLVLVTLGAVEALSRRGMGIMATAVPTVLIVTWASLLQVSARHPGWPTITEVQDLVQEPAMVVLSTDMSRAWPQTSYSGARWAAPIPSAWAGVTTDRGRALAVRALLPAIQSGVPVLVPVDSGTSALPLLLHDEQFRAAWGGYREVRRGTYYVSYRPVQQAEQ